MFIYILFDEQQIIEVIGPICRLLYVYICKGKCICHRMETIFCVHCVRAWWWSWWCAFACMGHVRACMICVHICMLNIIIFDCKIGNWKMVDAIFAIHVEMNEQWEMNKHIIIEYWPTQNTKYTKHQTTLYMQTSFRLSKHNRFINIVRQVSSMNISWLWKW